MKRCNDKIMIQIIDVSDKMLYNEVKAEQEFLTLINATVSHELRNPLTSLICQTTQMEHYFKGFKLLISSLKVGEIITEEKIKQFSIIYNGLEICKSKLVSAAKFIDFFVHDILDYTVLSKDYHKFIKNMEVFSLKMAIEEIIILVEDKVKMKRIELTTQFIGFDMFKKFHVKTDLKRL